MTRRNINFALKYGKKDMKKKLSQIVDSIRFAIAINLVIIINAVLIGVETFYLSPLLHTIQLSILGIFVAEIILRYAAKSSNMAYFTDGWNLFDIVIVAVCLIPTSMVENTAALSVFRVMRVFRILRLVKTLQELRIIVSVLLKSLKSLIYTFALLSIFMYMFAIMGVLLFRGGPVAANGPAVGATSPDP